MTTAAEIYHHPRCPECDSAGTYFRRQTETYACKKCGHTWPKPKEEAKS